MGAKVHCLWVKVKIPVGEGSLPVVWLIPWSTSATSTECDCCSCDSRQHNTHTSKNMIHYIFVPLNHCMATELKIVCISEHSTEIQSSSSAGHKQLVHPVSSSNFIPIQLTADMQTFISSVCHFKWWNTVLHMLPSRSQPFNMVYKTKSYSTSCMKSGWRTYLDIDWQGISTSGFACAFLLFCLTNYLEACT